MDWITMDTREFLTLVWPTRGHYALATPFRIPGTDKMTYAHKVVDTIDAALAFVEKKRLTTDIYYAIHTLAEPRVWNPDKTDPRTGEKGAYQIRVQRNMLAARCFFLDLDVDPSGDDTAKYQSQGEAVQSLIQFCSDTHLPKPLVTSSGGGLHIYWLLTDDLDSAVWREHAAKLKALAQHYGLKADPSRTTDTASVLRVPGTFNYKNPEHPRKVKVLVEGRQTATGDFLELISDAMIAGDVVVNDKPSAQSKPLSALEQMLGSNIAPDEFPKSSVSMKALAKACGQVRWFITNPAKVSEPFWYACLGLFPYVENGTAIAHKASSGYPGYSAAETDEKLAQLAKLTGPTSCSKLRSTCSVDACASCPHVDKIGSPVVAAKYEDTRPAPSVEVSLADDDDDDAATTILIPDPPPPYERLKAGIAITTQNSDGEDFKLMIFDHDLYPLRRITNAQSKVEQQVWRVHLPRDEVKDFVLDADALYDGRKFVTTIANAGLYPRPGNIRHLQDYMVAYISQLQREQDAEHQKTHLGWNKALTEFTLPDKILLAGGGSKPVSLSAGAATSAGDVVKAGTYERQVELMNFYNHRAYIANQFMIACSGGSAIFHATGQHGVIVNASGESGASKSTTLYTAASLWGRPEHYAMAGTEQAATTLGRWRRIEALSNLPVCIDEITTMPFQQARELAMGITQPGSRITSSRDGTEKRNDEERHKASITLTTANTSLHNLLSSNNAAGTAGSMRVVEMIFRPAHVHTKADADAFLRDIKQNYGHIGERALVKIMKNLDDVERAVHRMVEEIDTRANIKASERFWSSAAAAGVVFAQIARDMGALPFDPGELLDWFVNEQINLMRGVVVAEYSTPIGVLTDFLNEKSGNTLVTTGSSQGNMCTAMVRPHGEMVAHLDLDRLMLWVSKSAFKTFCLRIGANSTNILNDLSTPVADMEGKMRRVVVNKDVRKVLGAGTDYAKAKSYCFTIDITHPEIAAASDFSTAANIKAAQSNGVIQLP